MKPLAYVACSAAVEIGAVTVASIGLLLADVTVPDGALNGGIIGAIIVAGGAAVNWYLRWRKESNEQSANKIEVDQTAEDRKANRQRKADRDAWVEMQQVMSGMKADRDMDREEIHRIRDALQTEKMARAVADARLADCEKDRSELFRRVEALEKRG